VLGAAGGLARADGRVVFTQGGALWAQEPESRAQPEKLVDLPADVTAKFIWAKQDGTVLVVDTGAAPRWIVRTTGGLDVRGGVCTGMARPNPQRECMVCAGEGGAMLVSSRRDVSAPLGVNARELSFRGPDGNAMIGLTDEAVIGFDRRRPAQTTVLATNGARSHLLASPDGKRAVAVFGEGAASRIKAFVLDGEGVARQLGGPGVPVVWSWDSEWVLTQEGILPDEDVGDDDGGEASRDEGIDPWVMAAPKKKPKKKPAPKPEEPPEPLTRACAVRAVGGETKCWDHYEALAFSPDSTLVLLRRKGALYVGKIAGVRPEPPVKIVDSVDGAATWVPLQAGTQ
jgi:hypothetical protein